MISDRMSISSYNEDSSVSQLFLFGVPTYISSHVTLRMTNPFSPCIIWVLRCKLSGTNKPNILELIDRRASFCKTTAHHRAILGMFTMSYKEEHGHTGLIMRKVLQNPGPIVRWSEPSYFQERPTHCSMQLRFSINSLLVDFHFLFMFIFFTALLYSISPFISHIVIVNRVIDEVCFTKVLSIFYSCLP